MIHLKNSNKYLFTLLLVPGLFLALLTEAGEVEVTSPHSKKIDSLMFVGNSFFYYNNSIHNHLSTLVKNNNSIPCWAQYPNHLSQNLNLKVKRDKFYTY